VSGLTLYLLRHAKSGSDNPKLSDFDRPLAPRGEREAAEMAALIEDGAYRPARILCSSARRTRETLGAILTALPEDSSIDITRRLYDADVERLLAIVGEQRGTPAIMLIGHNPGLHQLARHLAGTGDDKALHRLQTDFPPASLATLEFAAIGWSEVRPGQGRLVAFETPSR
jgi:phosphohistidine phosphatase